MNSAPSPQDVAALRLRVVVADDDPVARRLLSTTLEPLGHDVVETPDGEQAWLAFEHASTAVVITDWELPGSGGQGLIHRIRSTPRPRYTYIIVVTAMRGRSEYVTVVDGGADDLLLKPFDQRELLARLHVASRIAALTTQVQQLERLLPVCAYCHRIRDEQGGWHGLESFLESRTGAQVSHGLCPGCYQTIRRMQLGEA